MTPRHGRGDGLSPRRGRGVGLPGGASGSAPRWQKAFELFAHITWTTRWRMRVVARCHVPIITKAVLEAADRHHMHVLAQAVLADHVHVLVSFRPDHTLTGFVRDAKSESSRRAGAITWGRGYYAGPSPGASSTLTAAISVANTAIIRT